jgi:tetratricopeptide (TPR) repeat protein
MDCPGPLWWACPVSMSPPDGSTFSVSVAGSVEGHLLVGIGNQLVTDANALLGAPDGVDLGTPLWNVPALPARDFIGRDLVLAELDAVIGSPAPLVTQAIYGMGGIGKTELVLQYAFAHRSRYPLVWWIVADDPDRLEAGLAALTSAVAARIGKVPPAGTADAAGWAIGYLAAHPGWLLVLDNVEDRADVEPVLSRLAGGRILITSRRDVGWESFVDTEIHLDLLTGDAAARLLSARSHQDDPVTAGLLAAELGHMPLALTQVGAYLAQTRTPMAAYLARLRVQAMPALAATTGGGQRTIARVWTLTLAAIAEVNPFAIDVLRTLAVLAPDNVPRSMLTGPSDPPGAVDDALGLLASYSMVNLTAQSVSTHRLVQAVVLEQARETDAWRFALASALAALRRAQPATNPARAVQDWPQWAVIVPHVDALRQHWPPSALNTDLSLLVGAIGQYLSTQGAHAAALAFGQQALAIVEAIGPDHPDTAGRLTSVALCLWNLGRPAEAVPLLERALTIAQSAADPDAADIANRMDNLGRILSDLNRSAEAVALHQQALAMAEAALGTAHPDLAVHLENLAIGLSNLGRAAEALPLQQRALAISEATLGPDHPDIAIRLTNLAVILGRLKRVSEAVPLEERALAISEAALGPDHPDVAARLDNLAVSLAVLDRDAEAVVLQQRALAISEAALGPDHPDVALRLNNLAVSLAGLGRNAEALPLAERAVRIAEARLPTAHPTTQAILEVRDALRVRVSR